MGLRLEFILLILIVAIVSSTLFLNIKISTNNKRIENKELEFSDTTFIEVDTEKTKAHLYGTYGKRENGMLTIENIIYSTQKLGYVHAKKGIYQEDTLYLYDDVLLESLNGYSYKTTEAKYNLKKQILYITAPFIGKRDKNRIYGESLRYDVRQKKIFGKKIEAKFYTAEK
jgi:hypothetical protein